MGSSNTETAENNISFFFYWPLPSLTQCICLKEGKATERNQPVLVTTLRAWLIAGVRCKQWQAGLAFWLYSHLYQKYQKCFKAGWCIVCPCPLAKEQVPTWHTLLLGTARKRWCEFTGTLARNWVNQHPKLKFRNLSFFSWTSAVRHQGGNWCHAGFVYAQMLKRTTKQITIYHPKQIDEKGSFGIAREEEVNF